MVKKEEKVEVKNDLQMMIISGTFTSSDLHVSDDQRMIFCLRKYIISGVGLGFEENAGTE